MRRYMRQNHRSGTPSKIVCFDCETKGGPHVGPGGTLENRLFLGCATRFRLEGGRVTRMENVVFRRGPEFLGWLAAGLEGRKRTYVFSHNLGFDLTAVGFWKYLEGGAFRPTFRKRAPAPDGDRAHAENEDRACMVVEDPPTIIDCESAEGKRVTFLDMMNYFPLPLSEIGAAMGQGKMPLPGDEASDHDWEAYCWNDVTILLNAVVKLMNWIKADELGNLRYTLSGQSIAMYRHRCLTEPILVGHEPCLKRLERGAYFGGRIRSYFIGTACPVGTKPFIRPELHDTELAVDDGGPVYRLDVNSCHPYVMRNEAYPVKYLNSEGQLDPWDLENRLSEQEGCAEVVIDSRDTAYPVREKDQVRYCTGRFVTSLCGPDLRSALGNGHVSEVLRAQFYQRGYPFITFVDACWQMREKYRQRGDKLLETGSKLLANALSGKLAQRSSVWETVKKEVPPHPWGAYVKTDHDTGEIQIWRALANNGQVKQPPGETEDNFPLIAAYVTAHARRWMNQLIRVAGGRNVYYEDSDSLHVSSEGNRRLTKAGYIDDKRPGALKVVARADCVSWRGPKNFCWDGVWTVAGVGRRAKIDAKGLFHETKFHGLKSALSGDPPDGPLTEDVTYYWPVPKLDGRISPDGWLDYPKKIG